MFTLAVYQHFRLNYFLETLCASLFFTRDLYTLRQSLFLLEICILFFTRVLYTCIRLFEKA